MWATSPFSDQPWASGPPELDIVASTASARIWGGAGHGPVKRNEPITSLMVPHDATRAAAWTEDDELALKTRLRLQDDDETLLLAITALVASRRLH
jgi:hypothetical protein